MSTRLRKAHDANHVIVLPLAKLAASVRRFVAPCLDHFARGDGPIGPTGWQELIRAIEIVAEAMRARIDITDGSGAKAVGRHQSLSEDDLQIELAFLTPNIVRQARQRASPLRRSASASAIAERVSAC